MSGRCLGNKYSIKIVVPHILTTGQVYSLHSWETNELKRFVHKLKMHKPNANTQYLAALVGMWKLKLEIVNYIYQWIRLKNTNSIANGRLLWNYDWYFVANYRGSHLSWCIPIANGSYFFERRVVDSVAKSFRCFSWICYFWDDSE